MNTSDEPKMSSASAAVGAAGGKQYACLVDGCFELFDKWGAARKHMTGCGVLPSTAVKEVDDEEAEHRSQRGEGSRRGSSTA